MSKYGETYGLEKVLELWDVGKLTDEQAIGQILLLVRQLDQRLQEVERELERRDRDREAG